MIFQTAWLYVQHVRNQLGSEIIAGEIVENLESALEQYGVIQESLKVK